MHSGPRMSKTFFSLFGTNSFESACPDSANQHISFSQWEARADSPVLSNFICLYTVDLAKVTSCFRHLPTGGYPFQTFLNRTWCWVYLSLMDVKQVLTASNMSQVLQKLDRGSSRLVSYHHYQEVWIQCKRVKCPAGSESWAWRPTKSVRCSSSCLTSSFQGVKTNA